MTYSGLEFFGERDALGNDGRGRRVDLDGSAARRGCGADELVGQAVQVCLQAARSALDLVLVVQRCPAYGSVRGQYWRLRRR